MMLKRRGSVWRGLGLLLIFCAGDVFSQYTIREGDEEGQLKSSTIIVPYAFSTETLGFGIGIGGSYGPKGESSYYGTAYGTDNGSSFAMFGGNLKFPGSDRLHFKPWFSMGHFTKMRVYVDGNPHFAGKEHAGSNESSPLNYREEDAVDLIADLQFIYTLPWGHYRDKATHTYITDNGLLKENPSGGTSLNPLKSGQSTILFRPYYRRQFTDVEGKETLFFQVGYKHDNRDFIPNPHRGYLVKADFSHDPDWLAASRSWTSVEGEFKGYVPLWDASWSRQQTLVFSSWTAYSPTYNTRSSSSDNGKPPYFAGPTLGGFWRMRGYPANRFQDKAAVYYSAEYRLMPEWQPFGKIGVLDPLKIRWWQIVGLVEAGRVAPSWDVGELHSDMKVDIGIGLRGMFHASVGRVDFVVSEEGIAFSATVGQTF